MTAYATNATGNWSSPTRWTPNGVPGNGDTASIGHATTLDVDATVGTSPPPIPSAYANATATGGGSSGGALPAGLYSFISTNVDALGRESTYSAYNAISIASGNIPRLTLPALPAVAVSRNVYLSAAGTNGYACTLYATGLTGTTIDLASGNWGNTVSAGVATGGALTQAAAASPPPAVLTLTAALTVAAGKTLTLRGDARQGNVGATLAAGAALEFDASAANTPASTTYYWFMGTASSQTSCLFTTSGSSGSRCAVRSNAGGANGSVVVGPAVGTTLLFQDSQRFNLAYTDLARLGTASADALQPNASGYVQLLDNCVFDACGRVLFNAGNATAGWNVTNCTWKNSLGTPFSLTGANSPSVARALAGCVVDRAPGLVGNGSTYDNCYFDEGWGPNSSTSAWTRMDNCFLRFKVPSGQVADGPITNSYVLGFNAYAAVVTGTATSATSTTFTDSTKSWTVNQWVTGGSYYTVSIVAGTGADQRRQILSNTATQLTLASAWDVTPDATSQYQIYQDIYNPHFINPGLGTAITGLIFEHAGVAPDGDCYLVSNYGTSNPTMKQCIVLPNSANLNSGTWWNFGGDTSTGTITFEHNTCCGAGQCAEIGDFNGGRSGMVASYKSNLLWEPTSTPAAYKVPKFIDLLHPVSGGPLDVFSPSNADYNAGWNLLAGSYLGNGYSTNLSTQAGAHDVNLADGGTGPAFVDPTRKLATWAASVGSAGTYEQKVADAVAQLKKRNDPAGYNSAYSTAALIAYVRAGFAPTNSALATAAHDGTTIGAVAYQAVGGLHPFFADASMSGGYRDMGF